MSEAPPLLYDRVGEGFFRTLVDAFYAGVATDQVLAPLYPDHPDYGPAAERLRLFLVQYWGGPRTYQEVRGHPRLRMRHMPFRIGTHERDRWLVHMAAAVERACVELPDDERDEIAAELMAYFAPAAEHLRNDTGLPITSAGYRSPS